jgi:hypothetical protein
MKTTLTALITALSITLPALAEDTHHPERADPPTVSKATSPDQTVKKMQANVKKMQSQLDRIGKAKGDAERQGLLTEHMQTMQENMMLTRNLSGDMGCPMMGGMMIGGGGMGNEAMMGRMQQMERRMDMMQTMLEQMGRPPAK